MGVFVEAQAQVHGCGGQEFSKPSGYGIRRLGAYGRRDGVGKVGGSVSAEVEHRDEEIRRREHEGMRGTEGGEERATEECGKRGCCGST